MMLGHKPTRIITSSTTCKSAFLVRAPLLTSSHYVQTMDAHNQHSATLIQLCHYYKLDLNKCFTLQFIKWNLYLCQNTKTVEQI